MVVVVMPTPAAVREGPQLVERDGKTPARQVGDEIEPALELGDTLGHGVAGGRAMRRQEYHAGV